MKGAGVPVLRPAKEGAMEPTRVLHPRKTTIPQSRPVCYTGFAKEVELGPFLEKLDSIGPAQHCGRASVRCRHSAGGLRVQNELDSKSPYAVALRLRTFSEDDAPKSLNRPESTDSRTRLSCGARFAIHRQRTETREGNPISNPLGRSLP
jgi:hypothetical protein